MNELKFVHITKTAGMSIEDCAIKKGIEFGRFHREYARYVHRFLPLKPIEIRKKYDWFLVVRNPYERIVSEFHCQWGGVGENAHNYNKEQFNDFIKMKILNRDPLGDHYSEQYLYLDPETKVHVLKFENIKEEFDSLMKSYNLDIELNVTTNKASKKIFSVNDLSNETIQLINTIYDKDFELFNYKKI